MVFLKRMMDEITDGKDDDEEAIEKSPRKIVKRS